MSASQFMPCPTCIGVGRVLYGAGNGVPDGVPCTTCGGAGKVDPNTIVPLDPVVIAAALLAEMEADNGCAFPPTEARYAQLVRGVKAMQEAGVPFTEEEVGLLAAGEESERDERFEGISGYLDVNEALTEIFDGDGRFTG
jgi:hypothetical protein